jgi:hypothetical protein
MNDVAGSWLSCCCRARYFDVHETVGEGLGTAEINGRGVGLTMTCDLCVGLSMAWLFR